MKKMLSTLMFAAFLFVFAETAQAAPRMINMDDAVSGKVSVQYTQDITKKIKVQISKDDIKYTYDIFNNDIVEFPLQMGEGTYRIMVLENISGTSYRILEQTEIKIGQIDDAVLFTSASQLVNFNGDMISVRDFKTMLADKKTTEEKIDLIYNFVVKNFSYDYNKMKTVQTGYIPVVDDVYNAKTGICYDFSVVFAAALRSNGIPAKLSMGYSTATGDTYHAWNEIFINGKWVVVDTTYDVSAYKAKAKWSMTKNASQFTTVKTY